jgi:FAD/FMN-containing dehydrogenase
MGAGIGVLMGHRGLMLDALDSVRLVTAEGELLTASETENDDLFWAIRGGGPNWGIIVSATYTVYDYTHNGQASIYDMVFNASSNRSYFETLHSFDNNLPAKLAMTNLGYYDREHDQVRATQVLW